MICAPIPPAPFTSRTSCGTAFTVAAVPTRHKHPASAPRHAAARAPPRRPPELLVRKTSNPKPIPKVYEATASITQNAAHSSKETHLVLFFANLHADRITAVFLKNRARDVTTSSFDHPSVPIRLRRVGFLRGPLRDEYSFHSRRSLLFRCSFHDRTADR